MLGRIQETDMGVPYRKGDYLYYSRTEEGKQYPIYCRKRGTLEAPRRGHARPERAGRGPGRSWRSAPTRSATTAALLAYSTDDTGFRQYTLLVKDLAAGETLPLRVERTGSVAWAADNGTLFYTVEDEQTKRQHRLYRHASAAEADDLVYEEHDEAFNIGVGRTRSGAYLVLGIGSHTTSEARVLPAERARRRWRLVAPRIPEQEYEVDHHGDRFYIRDQRHRPQLPPGRRRP